MSGPPVFLFVCLCLCVFYCAEGVRGGLYSVVFIR